jgi:hypothetical protein
VYGTNSRQALSSMAPFHSGMAIAFQNVLGTVGALGSARVRKCEVSITESVKVVLEVTNLLYHTSVIPTRFYFISNPN